MKFCLTLLGGFVLFHDGIHLLQAVGILLTILGMKFTFLSKEICFW